MTALIPRDHLFGNPSRASATIRPDGSMLAWIAPVDGVLNLWVAPRDDLEAARPITRDTGRGIRSYAWSEDGAWLLYLQDTDGDENDHVFAVPFGGGEVRDLTPLPGVKAMIVALPRHDPGAVVVALNDRIPQLHDLWRVDIATGERTLLFENDVGAIGFVVDEDGAVRAALRVTPEGGRELLARRGEGWHPLRTVGKDDGMYTGPVDVAGDDLLWIEATDRDTAALYTLDLGTGERTFVAGSDRSDLENVLLDPETKRLLAWADNPDRVQWHTVDEATGRDLARLRDLTGGDAEIVSRTHDDRVWIALVRGDRHPGVFHLFDRDAGTATRLFSTRPELEGAPLAPMEPVHLKARDGLPLVAYLTRPLDAEGPGPMVLLVHGGPWHRDRFGYDPLHQLLANRGYAVLSVNFRGSLGFGKRFVNAGDREWGAAMHTDLLDAVSWAVDNGVARADQVAIMGGSYGGYATLWGLAGTPEVFACGVDIVGPSNLETLIASVPEYWKPLIETFTRRVGDPATEEGRALLRDRSPLHRAGDIVRPLLIGQGANDPRVKQAESDQIVEAMRAHGIPVTYLLFPDEGHGFVRPENNLAFMAVAESFLAQWLGGRAEPVGDVSAASVQILEGREHVKGL